MHYKVTQTTSDPPSKPVKNLPPSYVYRYLDMIHIVNHYRTALATLTTGAIFTSC